MSEKRVPHNKLTWEQVHKSFIEVHGEDTYSYDNVEYVDTHTKIKIHCNKHDNTFFQTPKDHKKGMGCYYCGRERQIEKAKKNIEEVKDELFKVYGDEYDLSKINYINTKTEVEVICRTHGSFMKKPCDLLMGNACKQCKTNKSKYNNKELFKEESTKLFGDITDYSLVNEMGANAKVTLICTKHDCEFTLSVSARLSGQKCPKCSAENYRKIRTLPKDVYYERANETHDNKYTYDDDYVTSKHAITFYCKEHGRQRRNSYDHLRGAGCRKCEKQGQETDKISREGYINTAKGRVTELYLIKCKDDYEEFYKIGKTFRGVESRFSGSLLPYDYDIVNTYEGEAGEIWDLEESLHLKFKEYKYNPNKKFCGFSECYNLELPITEIINL